MTAFKLVAKLTLDSSEYEKDLKETAEGSSKLTGIWGKVGKTMKTAMAVGTAAVGAASAAVVSLTKKSIDAYAEYEQLAGGIEKIFDKADISGIMADANNAYKDLNMSVNQYLSAISQTGAAFAQTMGDQKGYDVARTGMKAIADYASGTGRNLDELNQKYALITRSTSSYQSIADQFSGILPATSKGFLEQAQAAGYLSDTYTKLTDVPIEEYQEAVTNMLKKGVTDMGLYGNTAKESMTTIQGALNMTKAAWQNLITGITNPDADLGQLMDNLVVAIVGDKEGTGLLNQIIPAIQRAFEGIAQIVQKAAPIIAEQFPTLIQSILPSLISAATSLIAGLIKALPSIIAVLVKQIPTVLQTLFSAIDEMEMQLEKVAVAKVKQVVSAIASGIKKGASKVVSAAKSMVTSLANSIASGISSVVQKAGALVKKIPTAIKSGLGSLKSVGTNLIAGLWSGIKAKFDSVISKVKSLAAGLPKAVKKVLGIASPSKVFRDQIGKNIALGMAAGIEDGEKDVRKALDSLMGATLDTSASVTFTGEPSMSTNETGGDVFNFNLNYDADADASDMLRDLARGVQRYRMAGAI